jgi:hypothetical protein
MKNILLRALHVIDDLIEEAVFELNQVVDLSKE